MTFRITVLVTLTALLIPTPGCRRVDESASNVQVDLSFDPAPPQIGTSKVTLRITDDSGEPITGATIKLEGNMNHAGMKPSFADLTERTPGHYIGSLDFTMGGDWFVVVTCKTSDGQRIERKFDVPGVRVP